ncbi:MAG: adenosylhomocysteinase [Acidimicrobiales bacterium]
MARAESFDVADLSLAPLGSEQAEWAARRMPVLRRIRERFAREQPLKDVGIGASLHVTPETANLLGTLAAGGAELAVCASNPLSTNDEVAAFLVETEAIATFAVRGEDASRYLAHVDAVLDRRPQVTVDDGCDLVTRLHLARPDQAANVIGGTEDTSTGAIRLRALSSAGSLLYPVMALGSASTRALFDHRHGTGQSTVDGIMRATNVLFAGATVVVAGYGSCGRGVAERARGLGAVVLVTEVDPLRALQAMTDGFRVVTMAEAAPLGEVFVTATGNRDVLSREHFAVMRDGAILANAGQFDAEIDVPGLLLMSRSPRKRKGDEASSKGRKLLRPNVEEVVLADGRRLVLLAEGRLVNLAIANGHPPQVMDLSFAVQALACEWLVAHAGELAPSVHELPIELDEEIAKLKLQAMGVTIDGLSPAQRNYLASWTGSF